MLPLLLPPAIAGATEIGYDIYRGIKSNDALKEIANQTMPQYMDAAGPLQRNYAMAEQQYRNGLSPAARNLALNTAASQRAQMIRSASELSGGQMSNALSRLGALNNAQMAIGLGAQDQAARERGMGQMMGINQQLSGLQQRDIAQNINYRLQKEQGYGLAKQQAAQGIIGALGGFGMATMNMQDSEADRQLYRDMYGLNKGENPTIGPSVNPASIGAPAASVYNPTQMLTGFGKLLNQPPTKMLGERMLQAPTLGSQNQLENIYGWQMVDTPYDSVPNLRNLPPAMGGTNLSLGSKFSTPSNMYNPYMNYPKATLPRNYYGADYIDSKG